MKKIKLDFIDHWTYRYGRLDHLIKEQSHLIENLNLNNQSMKEEYQALLKLIHELERMNEK